MDQKTWKQNGRIYTRQQIGNVVLISSATEVESRDPQVEVYHVQRNGLEMFQGYANAGVLADDCCNAE